MSRIKKMLPAAFKRRVMRLVQNASKSMAYRMLRERPCEAEVRHVVFVCKGNICRSAFAEHYLRTLDPSLRIESCGLDVDQGVSSPREAVQVAREFGVKLEQHSAKGVVTIGLKEADLIIPMEYWQYLRLLRMFPEYKAKIRLLNDFAPGISSLACNIYDPFGLGEGEYRRCFKRMQKALEGLKKNISVSGK